MATLSLVQRGTISATSADGAGPKQSTLSSAIKTASSIIFGTIRDRRKDVFVQRGTVTVSSGGTSPQNVTLGTAVDLACSIVHISVRENRDGVAQGVVAELTTTTNLQLRFYGTVDATENIEVSWEVTEFKARRGAYLRIVNTTTVELAWDGTLVTGETLEAQFDVMDLESVGDELKEIKFAADRAVSFMGENILQDLLIYDDAGNPVSYRLRTFDTKANLQAATIDYAPGTLQTGELSRVTVTCDYAFPKGDVKSRAMVRDLILTPTPGVN